MQVGSAGILHLLAPADHGGMESVVITLARAQLAAGSRVAVACLVPPGRRSGHPFVSAVEQAGVAVHVLEVGDRAYLEERRLVGELLRRLRSDVLHTHGYRPDVVDSGVARRMGLFTVTTVHGFTGWGMRGRLYERLQIHWFRRFGAVVAVSQPIRARLLAAGVPPARLHVVRNAWAPARPPLGRAEARAALGVGAGERVVGWVGRLSVEKGPDVMVEALASLADPGVRLSFVGAGPLEGPLRTRAEALRVQDRIRWHGPVPDAGRHLAAFDVVALSSRTEGTPMVLLEAMAAGTPVVATAVGGIPDVVTGREALLVPPDDPPALARALEEALSAEGADVRARAARERLARDFSVPEWVARYADIYASRPPTC